VTATGPQWGLSLLDIDDDEKAVPAASLLAGGPPWLVAPDPEPVEAPAPEEPVLRVVEPIVVPPPPEPAPVTAVPSPSPAVLDRKRQDTPAVPGKQALQSALLRVQALEAEVARLRPEVIAASSGLRELQQQYDLLVEVNSKNQRTIQHQELQLQRMRSRLRKAGSVRRAPERIPRFADRERGFRHSVVTAWATRTPIGEQADHPLPEYTIGPDFLDSLEALEGLSPTKVADVVVEVLTDRARELDGRDLHQLRESEAGGAPYRRRSKDGATAWRTALQRNTAAARRLHFWRLPDGTIELARVGHHDDMRM
jgi:hypothetical protein